MSMSYQLLVFSLDGNRYAIHLQAVAEIAAKVDVLAIDEALTLIDALRERLNAMP
jgi:chemotaxis signal transduction protein